MLNKLCGFPTEQKWKLLYRGSVDGFGADDFHHICDGKANTLTIVKSDSGNVFGGFFGELFGNVFGPNLFASNF